MSLYGTRSAASTVTFGKRSAFLPLGMRKILEGGPGLSRVSPEIVPMREHLVGFFLPVTAPETVKRIKRA